MVRTEDGKLKGGGFFGPLSVPLNWGMALWTSDGWENRSRDGIRSKSLCSGISPKSYLYKSHHRQSSPRPGARGSLHSSLLRADTTTEKDRSDYLHRPRRRANRAAHSLRPPRRTIKSFSVSSRSLYAAANRNTRDHLLPVLQSSLNRGGDHGKIPYLSCSA
jgi:hypothetical protein